MTPYLQCSQGKKKDKKGGGREERKTVLCKIKRRVQAQCLDEMRSSSYRCLPAINLSWWHSRASQRSALTDVPIIELSISPNYQSCMKIIHLLVNIKHIMSLLCVLEEVGKVKHSM